MELVEEANKLIASGVLINFKFTCSHCGVRQTFEEPNTMYSEGICEECGKVTKITHGGFMMVYAIKGKDS